MFIAYPVDVPVQDTNKVLSQGVSKVTHVGFKTPKILIKLKDNRRRSKQADVSMKQITLSLSMYEIIYDKTEHIGCNMHVASYINEVW